MVHGIAVPNHCNAKPEHHIFIYSPYTYLIGWSKYNLFYYGVRYAKDCHPSDFFKSYFTSSKYVKIARFILGEPDIIQIRKIFPNNPLAAQEWEHKVLKRLDAANRKDFLNKTDSKTIPTSKNAGKYQRTEKTLSKQSSARKGKANAFCSKTGEYLGVVSINDPRWSTNEIVGQNKGKKTPHSKPSPHKNKPKTSEHNKKNRDSQKRLIEEGNHPTQIEWYCTVCKIAGKGKSNFTRYHLNCEAA